MTGHFKLALAILLCARVAAGAAPALARDITTAEDIGGFRRTYTVFVPDRLREVQGPYPTVIVLHGGLGTASIVRRQMRMDPVAEREGFVTVYPDGLGFGWNDGRADPMRQHGAYGAADDVAFLRTVAQELIRDGIADRSRLFLTGVSNGGMMAFRMGCQAAELFVGIAPVVANMPADLVGSCAPARPVPLLLINATDDPLVPWNGGGVGFGGGLGQVISTADTIAFWRRVNDCSAKEDDLVLASGSSGGITGVSAKVYGQCSSGAPVALISIAGGGHRIPGREERAHPVVDWFLGPQNHSFETAEEVWRFFSGRDTR